MSEPAVDEAAADRHAREPEPPPPASDPAAARRRRAYALLILVGAALLAGRIAVVRSETGETPWLSANDRSRWQTIASLVHDGTYRTDRPQRWRDPETGRRTMQSIDRVMHADEDGRLHHYSSKPPLLSTLLAGVYALFHAATGSSVYSDPMFVGRWMLVFVSLLPMIGYWALLARVIERSGQTDWGRLFLVAAGVFGTHLLPFALSINNHLPAAISLLVGLWALVDYHEHSHPARVLVAGLAMGFAAANELPALSLAGLLGLAWLWRTPLRAILCYGGGLAVVGVAFFATNWIAHESLRPPYAHRGLGPEIARFPADAVRETPGDVEPGDESGIDRQAVLDAIREDDRSAAGIASVTPGRRPGWLTVWSRRGDDRPTLGAQYILVAEEDGWRLHRGDDWYDYPGSYWFSEKRGGVDRGEDSILRYAIHATVGHHGILSLTPLWLLSLWGAAPWLRRALPESPTGTSRRHVAAAIVVATAVCLVFYIFRPPIDRNYGGVSCCLRWMLWFTPAWLWLAVPAADRMANSRPLRTLGGVLLAASVFSVATALDSPWQHPWIYRYWEYLGWIAT